MKPIPRLTVSLWLALLVAAGGSALAADPQFGMIGLADGQTLRLTVIAYPPNPCVARIGFLTRTGAVPQPPPDKTVNLAPGTSDFVDLSAASLNLAKGARLALQPFVTTVPQSNSACVPTVELYTSSTRATVVALPQPQPDMPDVAPVFGPVGLALGDVMRLNVNAFPPNPCFAQIGFLTTDGTPQPIPDKTVMLAPGTGDFLDLHAHVLGLQSGERVELLPAVMMLPNPNGASGCQATVEVYSLRTGRGRIALNPQPLPP